MADFNMLPLGIRENAQRLVELYPRLQSEPALQQRVEAIQNTVLQQIRDSGAGATPTKTFTVNNFSEYAAEIAAARNVSWDKSVGLPYTNDYTHNFIKGISEQNEQGNNVKSELVTLGTTMNTKTVNDIPNIIDVLSRAYDAVHVNQSDVGDLYSTYKRCLNTLFEKMENDRPFCTMVYYHIGKSNTNFAKAFAKKRAKEVEKATLLATGATDTDYVQRSLNATSPYMRTMQASLDRKKNKDNPWSKMMRFTNDFYGLGK